MATPEQRKAYQKAYREKNKDRLLAAQRERNKLHYQANKETYGSRNRAWREANPERYKELTRKYTEANREKVVAASREWYAANKDRARATSRKNKLKGYGLTPTEFETMLIEQRGACLICLTQMKSPVVDHDHATGAVRGLLCHKCNSALGLLRDCSEVLQRAAQYLTRSSSGATSTPNKMP